MTYIENASVCSSDTNVNKSISKVEPDRCSMGWRQRGGCQKNADSLWWWVVKAAGRKEGTKIKLKKDSNKISCKTGGLIEKVCLPQLRLVSHTVAPQQAR